jgi:hypothetical protein
VGCAEASKSMGGNIMCHTSVVSLSYFASLLLLLLLLALCRVDFFRHNEAH